MYFTKGSSKRKSVKCSVIHGGFTGRNGIYGEQTNQTLAPDEGVQVVGLPDSTKSQILEL